MEQEACKLGLVYYHSWLRNRFHIDADASRVSIDAVTSRDCRTQRINSTGGYG